MLAALPGHAEGLGDARHRHMMNDHARQCPASCRTRELGTRIGCLTHVLAPHVSTRLAPVAAHAHVQDRGTPPAGYVRQAPDHRVTRDALAPAAPAPPVLTGNTARQQIMVWLNVLTRHLQPQAIQAITGTSLSVGTLTRFTKCQQHQPKPTQNDYITPQDLPISGSRIIQSASEHSWLT